MKECPVCHRPLKEVPKYGVTIDVCSTCRGVWLDQGELEKVVSLARDFRGEYEQMYERHYKDEHDRRRDDDRYDNYRHPYKRKKKHGILEIFGELFD
ncbi:MAG: hypothetical protein C4589_05465 [Peptococcaceae bacterium]|jgi:hypothetical protein|nr:MAG: hypothetical protein C4589_05465 [Peptococcaceae bacterium]